MVLKLENMPGELRDGFYVQPMMKRAWAAQIEILKEIDMICRRHQIKYFAQWGTLLGAVRHQGFIPWDDDMDLAMLRNDFERFLYYAETELSEGCQVYKSQPTLVRVVNSNTIRLDQEFLDRYHGCPYIVGIDLFCMDFLPTNREDEDIYVNLFHAVACLHAHWDSFEEDQKEAEVWEKQENKWARLEEIEELTGRHIDRDGSEKEQLRKLADSVAAMYWDTEYEEVTFVSRMFEQREYRIPRACFDRLIEVPFENTMIPILEDYDLLCRLRYGDDYMTPKREGACHDYPFFKEQMEKLRNYFAEQGQALPDFFDMVIEQEEDITRDNSQECFSI